MSKFLGNYKEILVGSAVDKDVKDSGAAGGVVTTLLLQALKDKIVDCAVVVGMDENKPWKIKIKTAFKESEIKSAAGSKYILIPFSGFYEEIIKNKDKKLAVVGIPCNIRIIRKLQKKGKLKNVKLLIGLFCGYNLPPEATHFLLKKLKIQPEQVKSLKYRGGKYPGGFLVESKNGKKKSLPKHYYDFVSLMFVTDGCLSCNEYTNELADISVGDAWGYDNSSIIIVRSRIAEELIKSKTFKTSKISEENFFKMHWHNVKHKKIGDSIFLKAARILLRQFGSFIPFRLLGFLAKTRRILIGKNF